MFLAVLHFVSEKNEDKISKPAQWTQWGGTRGGGGGVVQVIKAQVHGG